MEPAIDSLTDRVDSKYSMVIVAARRARQLLAGARKKVETPSDKPVTVALQELAAGVLHSEPEGERGDEGAADMPGPADMQEADGAEGAGDAGDAAAAESASAERPQA